MHHSRRNRISDGNEGNKMLARLCAPGSYCLTFVNRRLEHDSSVHGCATRFGCMTSLLIEIRISSRRVPVYISSPPRMVLEYQCAYRASSTIVGTPSTLHIYQFRDPYTYIGAIANVLNERLPRTSWLILSAQLAAA
ncbi:hypothetical protein BS47DRAFT_1485841 [Hydnum rufescens UP504]|uniref:Uncharacterized protein n=1 Tax=Hydnum rufescens UP504 TaxID=1448309 RepID=A0A9P6DSD2_9AGAM|nr:hypothetical protein BS47DRAFT_1485841 [Hydnum rufescens UP504]